MSEKEPSLNPLDFKNYADYNDARFRELAKQGKAFSEICYSCRTTWYSTQPFKPDKQGLWLCPKCEIGYYKGFRKGFNEGWIRGCRRGAIITIIMFLIFAILSYLYLIVGPIPMPWLNIPSPLFPLELPYSILFSTQSVALQHYGTTLQWS